jgi:hypothetical protein
VWAAIFPVGAERRASVRRTTDLLRSLVDNSVGNGR